MDYDKFLRKEVNKFLNEQVFDLESDFNTSDENEVNNFCNARVLKRLHDIRKLSNEIKKEIILGFAANGVVKNILTCREENLTDKAKSVEIQASKTIYEFIFSGTMPKAKGMIDYYAVLVGYNGFLDFKTKYTLGKKKVGLKEVPLVQTPSKIHDHVNVLEQSDIKSKLLKYFFKDGCTLYVFDQDVADDSEMKDKIESDHYPKIDVLILKKSEKSSEYFDLENIKDDTEKYFYGKGRLEWCGDNNETRTFNIVFDRHRRSLYLRFYFSKVGSKVPEIILGQFLVSKGEKRQIVSGSVILSRDKDREGNFILPQKPYTYDFRKIVDDENHSPPLAIKRFLFEKIYNWHKTPTKIFTLNKLNRWLNLKQGKHLTKNIIVAYDYLITYPISSFLPEKKEELFLKIQSVLKDGNIDKNKLENLYRWGELKDHQKTRRVNKMKKLLESKYSEDRKKTEIVIYPEDRLEDRGNNPRQNKDEGLTYEFFHYIRQSMNIIIILPEYNYTSPSSVITFAGYSVGLGKRVFIFYQNKLRLPLALQTDSKVMNIHALRYEHIDEIPFWVESIINCPND